MSPRALIYGLSCGTTIWAAIAFVTGLLLAYLG